MLSGLSGGTTIDQLDGRLRALIQWDRLDMADAILLHALLTELRSTMLATIGEGLLSPDDAVRIERVAGWVDRKSVVEGKSVACGGRRGSRGKERARNSCGDT